MDTGFRTEIGPGKEQADHAPTQPPATADYVTAARLNSARLKELGTDALAVADRLLRFGAIRQAEQLYRDVLDAQADDAEAWSRLGEVCHSRAQPASVTQLSPGAELAARSPCPQQRGRRPDGTGTTRRGDDQL